jgi:acetaldehyde dehydrogenase
MEKLRRSSVLELRALVGVDPASEGLARARTYGLEATSDGVDWLIERANDFAIVFEATSAAIHARHAPRYREAGLRAVDLTPAGVGPAVVPPVNLEQYLDEPNVNMITCGGQATAPIVAAVRRASPVPYAEIVSTVASRSAGPGTRQNIDEFTRRTSQGLVDIGGADRGKAIIVLNPAEPPILMRNTVYCSLPADADQAAIAASIEEMVATVAAYVPGFRLKSPPVFDDGPFETPGGTVPSRVIALLEVSGAADYLPAYAGNLDIMTAAAVRVGEAIGSRLLERVG